MPYDLITALLDFPDFRVVDLLIEGESAYRRVVVTLERVGGTHQCSGCGRSGLSGYDSHIQEVRHLLWWQWFTLVRFRRYRVDCPDCGVRTEALDFVDLRGPHVTTSLGRLVYELCKVMTHKAVGILMGLHRGTVKEIDKAWLEKIQSERPLDGITVLGFDEIGVGKGQTYWTMVSALEGPRGPELLNIVEGRKEKNLKPFWTWFGKDRARRITHGVMDMWKPYRNSLRAHCPKAQAIYDKFVRREKARQELFNSLSWGAVNLSSLGE